ncbi:universal stress protein [Mycobacterium sp.]|uniref:universal stress protein n=1 Tax=Mycobacterium sp. TaxID=1785 RepID=UPI002CF5EEFD|nr:universal stress protein [Mycobacterium sp.]HTY32163.1 universal stress protein [Mycobacterium sp.]
MEGLAVPQSIVVGIDGSRAAIRAALWAVDEAMSRDAPLRLLCAAERGDTEAAQTSIRRAVKAIEAAGRPVKIEAEVVPGPAIASLIGASASAAMVCVGAVGLRHFQPGRVGSVAAALAVSARCPVAIVRARDEHPAADSIVVELDGSPDNGVLLGAAVEEARLRNAAVRAIVCCRSAADEEGPAGDRRALADLDRRLARWKRRYPDLRVESLAVHGGLLGYLALRRSVGLVVVGARNRRQVNELVGPSGGAVLQGADCSVLVVNQQHL